MSTIPLQTPHERLKARPLTAAERDAFLRDRAESQAAFLRRLRDEAQDFPELLMTYGFASANHPPTPGLLSYLHDEVRQESARQIRLNGISHD